MQFSIKVRLAILVMVSMATCALIATMSWLQMRDEMEYAKALNEQRLKPVWLLESLSRNYSQGVVDTAQKLRSQMLFWGEGKKALEAAKQQIKTDWLDYQNHKLAPEERELLADIEADIEQSLQVMVALSAYIEDKSSYGLGNYIDLQMYAELEPTFTAIDRLMEQQAALAEAEKKAASQRLAAATKKTLLTAGVLSVALLLLSWWLARSILKPLGQMRQSVSRIVSGLDFTIRIDTNQKDELGDLARAFNSLVELFTRMLGEMNQITAELSTTADNLVATAGATQSQVGEQNQELLHVNQSIESVARAAAGVLASVEQTSTVTEQSEQSAQQGTDIVASTITSINQLAAQVDSSAQNVKQLNQSSESIGGVLAVISDIADQTNLLALNAAIEAARAGDQGRGFAVVADEVRQLAQRTAKSTMEIQTMIESIQQETKQVSVSMSQGVEAANCSVKRAEETGTAISNIVAAISDINQHSGSISNSAQEQIDCSKQLNERSNSLLAICNETERLAKGSADCSQSVAQASDQLRRLMSRYRT